MPGMMDTVLNLGLNDETVEGLATRSGDRRFAYDSYRRFIQMYSDVVLGVDHRRVRGDPRELQGQRGYRARHRAHRRGLAAPSSRATRRCVEDETGKPFPQDPHEQLWGAIGAVFGSWMNARAITYRRLHDIPDDWGTAVNVQAMVFGNHGRDLGDRRRLHPQPVDRREASSTASSWSTPRARTWSPASARRRPSPRPRASRRDSSALARSADARDLRRAQRHLRPARAHYRDMQDIEFTIEDGKLWMLQTRSGKRTAKAALKIAVDMVERRPDQPQGGACCASIPPRSTSLLHPTLDPNAEARRDRHRPCRPRPAPPRGEIVFDADEAEQLKAPATHASSSCASRPAPRTFTACMPPRASSPTRGGMTCHAAVVARGMGKPCVVGRRRAPHRLCKPAP